MDILRTYANDDLGESEIDKTLDDMTPPKFPRPICNAMPAAL